MKARGRVLVVDDEAVNRELLQAILEPAGYLVDTAAGAQEAVMALRASPPDVVLLDVMMPSIDGFALCRSIKEQPATRLLPVVMVSSLDRAEYRVESLEAGADDYLTKPVFPAEVVARVDSLIRAAERHREARGDGGLLSRLGKGKETGGLL